MPRRKSHVHTHYRPIPDQAADRKLEVVACIHCGKKLAGNNAARLLQHLQKGCWPADSQDDPRLEMGNGMDGAPITRVAVQQQAPPSAGRPPVASAAHTPIRPPAPPQPTMRSAPRPTFAHFLPSAAPTHYLLHCVVKDTQDPIVTRMIAVPVTFTFRHLQRALSAAFGYKGISGMFDVTSVGTLVGRGRPPRTQHSYIFSDQEQRLKWQRWEQHNERTPEERMADEVLLQNVQSERQGCKITYSTGTWVHDVEIQGTVSMPNLSARVAVCMSGEGHPVPESSDPMMWQAFKDAYQSLGPTAQQKRYRGFYEEELATGDARGLANGGPWRWEKDHVNRELSLLPPAPQAVKANPPVINVEGDDVDSPQQQDDQNSDGDEDASNDAEEDSNQTPAGGANVQGRNELTYPAPNPAGTQSNPPYGAGPGHHMSTNQNAYGANSQTPYDNSGYMPASALQQLRYG